MSRRQQWWGERFPLIQSAMHHLMRYQVPANLNGWYVFGAIALAICVLQFASGIALLFHYEPTMDGAFDSVQTIMRSVNLGWLIRYVHTTGASAFFIVVYLHMLRSMLYGSYRRPRELVWLFGLALICCLMAEAFFGYLLPWGQMSYWGAKVITSLFGAVPWLGDTLVSWIRGGEVLAQATLTRFYVLHILLMPTAVVGFILLHVISLHAVGSNHPDAGRVRSKDAALRRLPFYPYFVVRDSLAIVLFLLLFFAVVFYAPAMYGYFIEYSNSIPANPGVTPEHIVPMWYFSLFYAMLKWVTADMVPWLMVLLGSYLAALVWRFKKMKRSCFALGSTGALILVMMTQWDAKYIGMLCMLASVGVWACLPWLDQSKMRSLRHRPYWHRYCIYGFVLDCIWLGYSGLHALSGWPVVLAKAGVLIYFIFFLGMPWWSRREKLRGSPHE